MANLTLAVVPLAVLLAVVLRAMLLATLDVRETSESREPLFFRLALREAPVGLCTTHVDGRLLDGDLLTLCTGANRPYLGEHSKYLDQRVG